MSNRKNLLKALLDVLGDENISILCESYCQENKDKIRSRLNVLILCDEFTDVQDSIVQYHTHEQSLRLSFGQTAL